MHIIGKKRRRQKTVDYAHIVMEDGVMSRETVSRNTLAEAMARHDAYVRRAQAGFPGENRDLPPTRPGCNYHRRTCRSIVRGPFAAS